MSDDTCAFPDGCDAPAEIKARKLCKPHYQYMWRRGLLTEAVAFGPESGKRKCSAGDCENKHKAHGFCKKHLYAEIQAGNLPSEDCSFPECGRPPIAHGYCHGHNQQVKRGKPLAPLQAKRPRIGTCGGPGCDEPILAKGYCGGHYEQLRNGRELTEIFRGGPNLKGQPCVTCAKHGEARESYTTDGQCHTHARYRAGGDEDWERKIPPKAAGGEGHTDKFGYRIIQHEGRQRREHSVMAELLLGRALTPNENVHHVNGNRSDNRTDGPFVMDERGRLRSGNLEVWSTAQPAGQEIGPKVTYSIEILAQYGEIAALWEADLDVLERVLAAHGRKVVRSRQPVRAVG
jgi:hypothetical protein